MIRFKQISSLEKVLLKDAWDKTEFTNASVLRGERFSWQIMYTKDTAGKKEMKISVDSEIPVKIYRVGNVPVTVSHFLGEYDDQYISLDPGLYPDVLYPLDELKIEVVPGVSHALWLTAEITENISAGSYQIMVTIKTEDQIEQFLLELEVIDAQLPEQRLIYTQWFHCDCIASYYNIEIFTEEHWSWIEKFIKAAVYSGINMLLTPLFTPPLDTKIGCERSTVQLVEVYYDKDYQFNFDKLSRWIKLCKKYGVKYFEMSHLFTQWGAEFTPKIIIKTSAGEEKRFGWHVRADSKEYKEFLDAFLPALTHFLKEEGIENHTYFHISDEPALKHKESYGKARELVLEHLKDFPVMDALSDYDFYSLGLVKLPVPANNHIDPFIDNKVKNLWTYYCCCQGVNVSNRFIAMPSYRNRIIGAQLYKYNIVGFLHWGFNFYYSPLSTYKINPFTDTDAGGGFPSGDAFSIYPGENEPLLSIRSEVFYHALEDIRAMELLESLAGRKEVMKIIESFGEIRFTEYPKTPDLLLNIRNKINDKIKTLIR